MVIIIFVIAIILIWLYSVLVKPKKTTQSNLNISSNAAKSDEINKKSMISKRLCPDCNGNGFETVCKDCLTPMTYIFEEKYEYEYCKKCTSEGKTSVGTLEIPCSECNGSGRAQSHHYDYLDNSE